MSSVDEGATLTNLGSMSPITWVDVARRLSVLEPTEKPWRDRPSGLRGARVDWRGATFTVEDPTRDRSAVIRWLSEIFPYNRIEDGERPQLVLEGPPHNNRLPIDFESEDWQDRRLRPNLGSVDSDLDFLDVAEQGPTIRPVPIVVCHSVKGGTGRTITAITTAVSWARRECKPVLLVDADLEAPGISYIFRTAQPEARVSLEDLVAIAHADPDPDRVKTVRWVADRLADHRLGDLVVLPLRRDLDELGSSSIRAEHLSSPDTPYAFADLLAAVAQETNCVGVVVDVRAGLVPLAAQLILDPSISRIVVTSLSGQSLEATAALMRFTARELRRIGATLPPPLLVVNRVPTVMREFGEDDRQLAPALDQITADLLKGHNAEVNADELMMQEEIEVSPLQVVKIPEISDLQVTSTRWSGYTDQIETSGFLRRLGGDLEAWLAQEVVASRTSTEDFAERDTSTSEVSPADRREKLRDFANRLVAAETADRPIETPLVTGPMLALARTFSGQLPIVVSEGAKGSGKTLTARFLVGKGTWRSVVALITKGRSAIDSPILPVLGSIQTSEQFLAEIDACRSSVAKGIAAEAPQRVGETKRVLRERLQTGITDRAWTDLWLDAIAWSAGVNVGVAGAGAHLLERLRERNLRLLSIVEGIEELYESANDPALVPMLRALLLDLPVRLRGEPGRPLGLIVFARRDTVDAGVAQNRDQFRTNYADYSLTWNESDVLELAAWLTTQAGALSIWTEEFRGLPDAEKEEKLELLWGRKLGRDEKPNERIKEAYTARWVIAALSDLQGRLVARDLVRFLHYSAAYHPGPDDATLYGKRLLVPRALKEAIGPTSEKKVTETEEEIGELRSAFAKFRERPGQVVAPIDETALTLLGLDHDDIERLRRHGIIFGEAPPYEVPELFRLGLKLRHGGARYSVLNLRRRARQRFAAVT